MKTISQSRDWIFRIRSGTGVRAERCETTHIAVKGEVVSTTRVPANAEWEQQRESERKDSMTQGGHNDY